MVSELQGQSMPKRFLFVDFMINTLQLTHMDFPEFVIVLVNITYKSLHYLGMALKVILMHVN